MPKTEKVHSAFILSFLKPYHKFIALLIGLSFLTAALDGISVGLLVPLLAGLQQVKDYEQLPRFLQLIAELFAGYSFQKQLLYSVGAIVLAVLAKNLFFGMSIYLGHWLTGKLIADLRIRVMELLMEVGVEYYHRTRIGHLVDKVMFNTQKVENVIKCATEFLVNLAILIVLLGLMFIFSWQLTLVTLLCSLVIIFAMSRYAKAIAQTGQRAVKHRWQLAGALAESIAGIFVIKYFQKERAQLAMLREKIESLRKHQQRLQTGMYLMTGVSEGMGVIVIGVLFVFAVLFYDMKSPLVVAQLLSFIYILIRLIPTVKELNRTRGSIAGNWPFLQQVEALLRRDDKPFIPDGSKTFLKLKRGIRFQSVTFAYRNGETPALEKIDLFIPRGKTTAFVGESGAGKSTLINLLLRLYDPQAGRILVDGIPLTRLQIAAFRRIIGIVSQDTFIFNDTVKNNIAFGAKETPAEEAIIAAAHKAGAHEFIIKLPEGYDTQLGDRGIRLSGGQRQRISIARAILKDPEILILDEATSSLDTRTEKLIHQAISALSRNRTVIIIAHRLSTIEGADQIIVLKNGRVVEVGSTKQLFEQKGEYYQLAHAR